MTSQKLRETFNIIKQDTGAEYLFGTFYGRHKHLCCSGCAGADLASNGFDTGFFFHEQAAERVHDGDDLSIGYFAPTDEATKELGAKIAWHLLSQGFTVEWNGDPSCTIFVGGINDWDPDPWRYDDYDEDDDWDDDYDDDWYDDDWGNEFDEE